MRAVGSRAHPVEANAEDSTVLEARHKAHPRVEDRIRHAKIGPLRSRQSAVNRARTPRAPLPDCGAAGARAGYRTEAPQVDRFLHVPA